ncbi:MAG: 50S ribosomal protein L24e [Thermoplasmata archaeon]
MVERRVCTFCGDEIEPGTGRMYIKKDGVVYNFCSSKCFKNLVVLGRVPRRTTWTRYYEREKQVRMKGAQEEAKPTKARKVKKAEKDVEEGSAEKQQGQAKEEQEPTSEPSHTKASKKAEGAKPVDKKKTEAHRGERAKESPKEAQGG